jgi:ABC-type multidrug transport system fused ATPase/permease subunit
MISLLVVLVAFIRQSGAVLHQRLLETISTATLTLYTLTDIGVLTNYFSQDMNLIDSELPLAFLNILLDLASVIGMAALLASASPWLILAYPGLILILWYLQHFYLRTSRQVRLLDLEAKSPLYAHFLDTLKGITTIRAFGWVGHSMARHKQLLEQSQRATYMRSMIQRWLFLALGIIVMIVATALVALITQIGAGADISGASLVTLMTFSQSLTDIVRFYAALETSIGSVARLKSFMATTDSEVKPGRDVKPDNNWPSTGRLVLQNAWASYKYVLITSSSIFVHVC